MSAIPITVTGTIATEPTARTLPSGRACASFRLAVNHWRVDKSTGEFIADGTSWFGVDCYGELASNSAMSLTTGAAVIVTGSLRNREWATEERSGISPTVVAEHIGPDLRYGTAHYKRAKATDRSQPLATQTTTESAGSPGAGWDVLEPSPPDTVTGDSESLAPRGAVRTTGTGGEDDRGTEADGGTERDVTIDSPEAVGADSKTGDEDDPIARETANAAAPF